MGEFGRIVYDFFWNEYADWYIESAKDRIYGGDAGAKEDALATLLYTYNVLLRVMHPIVPFITEELYQALPRPADQAAARALVVARWPAVGAPRSGDAERDFAALQAVVRAVRNVRAEYGVELGKKVPAQVEVADDALRATLRAEVSELGERTALGTCINNNTCMYLFYLFLCSCILACPSTSSPMLSRAGEFVGDAGEAGRVERGGGGGGATRGDAAGWGGASGGDARRRSPAAHGGALRCREGDRAAERAAREGGEGGRRAPRKALQ